MALTHTHPHDIENEASDHVTNDGQRFGAEVHNTLLNGGGEHTHDDVWEARDEVKDAFLIVSSDPGVVTPEEREEVAAEMDAAVAEDGEDDETKVNVETQSPTETRGTSPADVPGRSTPTAPAGRSTATPA